jgi:transcription elongation factor Elf1
MKTLKQHDEERREFYKNPHSIRNGIECPKCGAELLDSIPDEYLYSFPPKKAIHCAECGFDGYALV